MAANRTSCLKYSPLTRISFIGWGVKMAFTFVTIGPWNPYRTIWSFYLRTPSTKMQSIVGPWPSITFLSSTVQLNYSFTFTLLLRKTEVYLTITANRSGIPFYFLKLNEFTSPVIPDVGTIETKVFGSSFFQNSATLKPYCYN